MGRGGEGLGGGGKVTHPAEVYTRDLLQNQILIFRIQEKKLSSPDCAFVSPFATSALSCLQEI